MSKKIQLLISGAVACVVIIGLISMTAPSQHVAVDDTHSHAVTGEDVETMHEHEDAAYKDAAALSGEALTDAVLASIADGKYKCCLTEACTSCFIRHQNEAEDLICDCLEDLINSEAPCRQCVDGILAGEGNRYLAQYFASSLSARFGEDRYQEFASLVTEQYGVPIDQQYQ